MGWLIAIAVLIALMLLSVRVAKEHERFAVFIAGRYAGLRGPGLLFHRPGSLSEWHRVAIGDTGESLGSQLGKFGQVQVPVSARADIAPGSSIRIDAFECGLAVVVPNPLARRMFECERCGHTNRP